MGGGDEDFMRDLEARAKRCKWYEQLQTFLPLQTLFSFSVPRVICIGEESSGKSSTLERLAELSIFPTDRKLCTRMPIELRLRHQSESRIREFLKDDRASSYVMMQLERGAFSKLPKDMKDGPFTAAEVASKVKEWMESIVHSENGELSGVTDNRLIIELYSTRRLNLDLIDLPGIVAGHTKGEPSNMMEQTRRLTEKYLQMEHTLILLVVSNRAERIRNSQAFELVQRHHKEKQTIGVLTMVDRCSDHRKHNDPFWELKERLEGLSDDLPELAGGYIALKNRDTTCQEMTIQSANAEELDWFQTHLSDLNEETKSCLGMGNLVSKLLLMLQLYTEETWSVAEHKRLANMLNCTKDKLRSKVGEAWDGDLLSLLASEPFEVARTSAKSMASYESIGNIAKSAVQELFAATGRWEFLRKSGGFYGGNKMLSSIMKANDLQKYYECRGELILAIEKAFGRVIQEAIADPAWKIIDHLISSDTPPMRLNQFTRLQEGLKDTCHRWVENTTRVLMPKLQARFCEQEIMFNPGRNQYVNLRNSPAQFLNLLYQDTTESLLCPAMIDLVMCYLVCHGLDKQLHTTTLEQQLNVWWNEKYSRDVDIQQDDDSQQSPLTKEDPSYTTMRSQLQGEIEELKPMIAALESAFPHVVL